MTLVRLSRVAQSLELTTAQPPRILLLVTSPEPVTLMPPAPRVALLVKIATAPVRRVIAPFRFKEPAPELRIAWAPAERMMGTLLDCELADPLVMPPLMAAPAPASKPLVSVR